MNDMATDETSIISEKGSFESLKQILEVPSVVNKSTDIFLPSQAESVRFYKNKMNGKNGFGKIFL